MSGWGLGTSSLGPPEFRAGVAVCVAVCACGCECVWLWVCSCECVWLWAEFRWQSSVLVAVGLLSWFPCGLAVRWGLSSFLRVACIPCHVASCIFKARCGEPPAAWVHLTLWVSDLKTQICRVHVIMSGPPEWSPYFKFSWFGTFITSAKSLYYPD